MSSEWLIVGPYQTRQMLLLEKLKLAWRGRRGIEMGPLPGPFEGILLNLNLQDCNYDENLLSYEEKVRAGRYVCRSAKRQFIASRAILREVLGEILACAPADIRLGYEKMGKPAIIAPHTLWKFNVSHSDTQAVIAFAFGRELGIDIEKESLMQTQAEELAQRFFSPPEFQKLMTIRPEVERIRAFFRCWTRKEALLKALGVGLTGALNRFSVSLDTVDASILDSVEETINPKRWQIVNVPVVAGYMGAMAIESIQCLPKTFSGFDICAEGRF